MSDCCLEANEVNAFIRNLELPALQLALAQLMMYLESRTFLIEAAREWNKFYKHPMKSD